MDNRRVVTGLGLGMLAGGVVGWMMAAPNRGRSTKKKLDKALKGMGGVMRDVSDVLLR